MKYVDTDQPIMWLGASDFSKGNFFEPRYYGQNYNTLMEGFFAVPLIWMNVPVYLAVPLVTHFLFLAPFLFSAIYLFTKEKKEQAFLILGLMLCMPLGNDILTAIPRGFVTGIFFSIFFMTSLLNPTNLKFGLLNTVMAAIGFFVNPNSIFVSAPVLFYIFLHNFPRPRYYLLVLAGLVSAVIMYLLLDKFYADHPDYNVVSLQLIFAPSDLLENLSHLDEKFAHITFFMDGKSVFILSSLALLLFCLFRTNIFAGWSIVLGLLLVIVSFCFRKNIEGAEWPYYSFSRMYVGIPLLLALFLALIKLDLKLVLVFLIVPLGFSVFKLQSMEKEIERISVKVQNHYVTVMPLASMIDAIDFYKKICMKNNGKDLFISKRFWMNSVLTFGGPAVRDSFPATQEVESERRYWIKQKNCNRIIPRFVFISALSNFDKEVLMDRAEFTITRLDDYGLFLITNNKVPTSRFMELVRNTEFPSYIQLPAEASAIKCL